MKRFLIFILAVCVLAAVPACKRDDGPDYGNKPVVDASLEDEIKIGVISSGDAETDNAYVQSHLQGIEAMRMALGLSEDQIHIKTGVPKDDREKIREAVTACADEGCKIIFSTEPEYEKTVEKLAAKYPDIVFGNALSQRNNDKNLSGFGVRMYKVQYLSGIVAGLRTDANMVGYVVCEDGDALVGINAFALGVERANPAAVVYLKKVSGRCDSEAEKVAAEALLGLGCDVIGQNTFSSAPQIAAEAAGCWGCGYTADMTSAAPKGHLQAPVVNWGLYYTRTVKNVIEDKWKNENFIGGLGDGFVDLSPVTHNCKRGTTAAVNDARAELMGGYNIFTGPLRNNRGETVCPEGEDISEEELFKGMDWHYKNIVELS